MELKAAAGLHLAGRQIGDRLSVELDGAHWECALGWSDEPPENYASLERKRITETGAEAIALAVVFEAKGWQAKRRMDEGEFADWLLTDRANGRCVALEVSGCATTNRYRLRRKLSQVTKCEASDADVKAAFVVEFGACRAALAVL